MVFCPAELLIKAVCCMFGLCLVSGINNSDSQWLNIWLLVIGVVPSHQRIHKGERTRMFILQLNRKMAHPASAGKCEEGVDFNEGELRDFMNYKTF